MNATTWEPGDPLHTRPARGEGRGVARSLIEVIDEDAVLSDRIWHWHWHWATARCLRCQVTWADRNAPCFVCGGRSS